MQSVGGKYWFFADIQVKSITQTPEYQNFHTLTLI